MSEMNQPEKRPNILRATSRVLRQNFSLSFIGKTGGFHFIYFRRNASTGLSDIYVDREFSRLRKNPDGGCWEEKNT
jgi:hypothetical protein